MQRQARLRCDSGTAASAEGFIVIVAHQHGVANDPVRAGAHSFAAPQSGHWAAAMGTMARWSGVDSGLTQVYRRKVMNTLFGSSM
jgi:hypothetical protein